MSFSFEDDLPYGRTLLAAMTLLPAIIKILVRCRDSRALAELSLAFAFQIIGAMAEFQADRGPPA